jgi:hypothetical protein
MGDPQVTMVVSIRKLSSMTWMIWGPHGNFHINPNVLAVSVVSIRKIPLQSVEFLIPTRSPLYNLDIP